MHAFTPDRLGDLPETEFFSLPAARRPAPQGAGLFSRIYARVIAAWRREPELSEMGPSQIHELMVMRGRD